MLEFALGSESKNCGILKLVEYTSKGTSNHGNSRAVDCKLEN